MAYPQHGFANAPAGILLVEGKDDFHVILALCDHFGIPEQFRIQDCESRDGVLKNLDAHILSSDAMSIIGVVLDADDSSTNRWRQVAGIVAKYGYSLPASPKTDGSVVKMEGRPDLGVWLMPNNADAGMLEDFLLEMADEEALACARNCVEKALADGVASFKKVYRSKAEIYTYLAWQGEPGKPLGLSITAHALRPNTPTADQFAEWLKKLFG